VLLLRGTHPTNPTNFLESPPLTDKCPDCGAAYALVGRVHRCAVNKPVPVVNSAVNKRGAYPATDERRAYMREYMRKKRDGRRQDR
jgi:hypothetical protein